MKINWFDEQLVTIKNMSRMARRRGKRDGKAEKPSTNSGKNSVPFLSQAHAHFSAEAEKRIAATRKSLNERIYETLERDEQIVLLESQLKKVNESLLEEEIRVKHKFEYIPEIEDRINEQNENLKLIGGYHYSLACKECRNDLTSQDRKHLDYILRKHNYKSEIRSYTPTDSYMIKLK